MDTVFVLEKTLKTWEGIETNYIIFKTKKTAMNYLKSNKFLYKEEFLKCVDDFNIQNDEEDYLFLQGRNYDENFYLEICIKEINVL